jgi:hypothetical protein
LFAAVIHFPLDRAFAFVLQEKHQRRLRQAAIQRRNQECFYALDGAPFRLVGRLILCARQKVRSREMTMKMVCRMPLLDTTQSRVLVANECDRDITGQS